MWFFGQYHHINCFQQVNGPTFCVRKLTLPVIVFFQLTYPWRRPSNFKMHTSLKKITERAQKCDFSVNITIWIAYNKSTARHFVSESWHYSSLCFSSKHSLEEDLPTLKCTLASKTFGEGTKMWFFGQFPHFNRATWFQIRHFVSESWHYTSLCFSS